MDNKYLFMVVGGIFSFGWFWVGFQPYYATDGGDISSGYLMTAVLALALGGGNSEGSDLIAVLTSSITGFVSKFIGLLVALVIGRGIYEGLLNPAGYSGQGMLETVAVVFASGILVILTVACLKKTG